MINILQEKFNQSESAFSTNVVLSQELALTIFRCKTLNYKGLSEFIRLS